MQNKKIILAGGTGFIGQALATFWGDANEIIILTREIGEPNNSYRTKTNLATTKNIKYVKWNAKDQGHWRKEIDAADLVINLCGKSVNCRYTKKNKQEIFDSRTQSTNALGEAIRNATHPPKLWVNAASATIYRHALDKPQDEDNGEIGTGFSVEVCKLWEKTFFDNRTPFTRKISLRMAIVLGAGGVLVPFLNLVKFGLGGKQGSGKQMFSWIHIQDVINMMEWLYQQPDMEGVYNCSIPNPISNQELMHILQKATNQSFALPTPTWMLKLGSLVIGTETELLLKSRWVIPTKILEAGYRFEYPILKDAIQQIVHHIPKKAYAFCV